MEVTRGGGEKVSSRVLSFGERERDDPCEVVDIFREVLWGEPVNPVLVGERILLLEALTAEVESFFCRGLSVRTLRDSIRLD